MKSYEVQDQNQPLPDVLSEIWEQSVRATHLLFSGAEVNAIRAYVPQGLKSVEHLIAAETEKPIVFMGVQNGRLEMLFITPEERGKGMGKQLLQYGFETYGIVELTVNEQNPQAVGFYAHMGFEMYKRTELDEEGHPYPLLYMNLVRKILAQLSEGALTSSFLFGILVVSEYLPAVGLESLAAFLYKNQRRNAHEYYRLPWRK